MSPVRPKVRESHARSTGLAIISETTPQPGVTHLA